MRLDDLPVVAEMMHRALEPFYGGDHRAHARRIVETAANGAEDAKGHFSAAQVMYVAEQDGQVVGILNFVAKYQGTLKISPLIVREEFRKNGISRLLYQQLVTYAREHHIRQIYCTVSAKNTSALEYFLAQGFVRAGIASSHYRPDMDEVMLYKITGHGELSAEERTISVLPLIDADEDAVRRMIIEHLAPNFGGVDDRWVDALFAGYRRRDTLDPNEKYKLIWVAKEGNAVLGVAAATPKKGEPIKLMPLVAKDAQAFAALVAELPGLARAYGHKLYTHIMPTSVEVETLQRHGWSVEAMMPDAYLPGVVTQQWGLVLKGTNMRMMRVKRQYFDAILAGTKPLEVRVGYGNIRGIKSGDQIRLECGRDTGVVEVVDVRVYPTFAAMLAKEQAGHIVPDNPANALSVLQGIYPPEKEALGVHVLQLKVIERPRGK